MKLTEPFLTIALDPSWTAEVARDDPGRISGARCGAVDLAIGKAEATYPDEFLAHIEESAEAARQHGLAFEVEPLRAHPVGGVPARTFSYLQGRRPIGGCPVFEAHHRAFLTFGSDVILIALSGRFRTAEPPACPGLSEMEEAMLGVFPFDAAGKHTVGAAFRSVLEATVCRPDALGGQPIGSVIQTAAGRILEVRTETGLRIDLPGLCTASRLPTAAEWTIRLHRRAWSGRFGIDTDYRTDPGTDDSGAFRRYLLEHRRVLEILNGDWSPILDQVVAHFLPIAEAWRDPDEESEPYASEGLRRKLTKAHAFLTNPMAEGSDDSAALVLTFSDEEHGILAGHGLGVFFDAEGSIVRLEMN